MYSLWCIPIKVFTDYSMCCWNGLQFGLCTFKIAYRLKYLHVKVLQFTVFTLQCAQCTVYHVYKLVCPLFTECNVYVMHSVNCIQFTICAVYRVCILKSVKFQVVLFCSVHSLQCVQLTACTVCSVYTL